MSGKDTSGSILKSIGFSFPVFFKFKQFDKNVYQQSGDR
jgi:hypothetical protein